MSDGITYDLMRVRTAGSAETTVYVVRHPRKATTVRAIHFPEPHRLDHWCVANQRTEAMVAGFFARDPYRPLGELRIGGRPVEHEPIRGPWAAKRGCLHVDGDGSVRMAPREQLPDEPG